MHTARLMDAPQLKRRLAVSAAALGLIVSEPVHDSLSGRSAVDFGQIAVRTKESSTTAWIGLYPDADPDHDPDPGQDSDHGHGPDPDRT